MNIKLAIVDDHQLFLKSLSFLIATFENFTIEIEAVNGKDLIEKMKQMKVEPDIVLLDVKMPVMDGKETAEFLLKNYPAIKTVALSMKDDEASIISMLKAGCCAYLLKDIYPAELRKALNEINEKGYYNADAANINFRRLILHEDKMKQAELNSKELEFLKHACNDIIYKQIAVLMHVSERTIDSYRDSVFRKLNVQTRTGMVMEALRKNIVQL